MFFWHQNELLRLDNENETLALDIEKFEKYLAGLASHHGEKEAQQEALAKEFQQKGVWQFEIS